MSKSNNLKLKSQTPNPVIKNYFFFFTLHGTCFFTQPEKIKQVQNLRRQFVAIFEMSVFWFARILRKQTCVWSNLLNILYKTFLKYSRWRANNFLLQQLIFTTINSSVYSLHQVPGREGGGGRTGVIFQNFIYNKNRYGLSLFGASGRAFFHGAYSLL